MNTQNIKLLHDTDIKVEEVFEAYYECRKTKRYSKGALSFEVDIEENLMNLFYEIKNRIWQPGSYNCFIVTKPVPREIFAAPFRDRIVHHILINRLNPFFEKFFIQDSFACRVGKGTHAAIKRVEHFIKSQSENGKKDCYVLKLDIKGFFMNINRNLLWQKLNAFIDECFAGRNYKAELEKYLCKKIIFCDPCTNCNRKSPLYMWHLLPKDKSLFTTAPDSGLPIGNLTSQVFANFYLSFLDHYVKHDLAVKKYVRYVDDAVFVAKYKEELKPLIYKIKNFLEKQLYLTLHPKKIYLQKASHGVAFLGTFIKPHYTVSSRRVKNNFVQALKNHAKFAEKQKPDREALFKIRSSVNSYFGIFRHYKNKKFIKNQILFYFDKWLKKHFCVKTDFKKVSLKMHKS